MDIALTCHPAADYQVRQGGRCLRRIHRTGPHVITCPVTKPRTISEADVSAPTHVARSIRITLQYGGVQRWSEEGADGHRPGAPRHDIRGRLHQRASPYFVSFLPHKLCVILPDVIIIDVVFAAQGGPITQVEQEEMAVILAEAKADAQQSGVTLSTSMVTMNYCDFLAR